MNPYSPPQPNGSTEPVRDVKSSPDVMWSIESFRVIVAISALLEIIRHGVAHFSAYLHPRVDFELIPYGINSPIQNIASFGNTLALLFLLLWLFASFGMFFFQRWGLRLFVGLYVACVPLYFIYGGTFSMPIDSVLSQIVCLLDGAILALAYTEPLKSVFLMTHNTSRLNE